MATLIILLVFASIGVFIYQTIILPSIRFYLRLELFKLRDNLRWIIYENKNKELQALNYLEDSINNVLRALYELDARAIYEVNKLIKNNTKLLNRINKRRNLVENYPNPRVQSIRVRLQVIILGAFFANSFIFLLSFIPIILIFLWVKEIWQLFKDIIFYPKNEIEDVFPANIPVKV